MIALLIYMPSTRNRRVLNIAIVVFMYIALGESWNVLSGLTGIFSIAHCIFYGIGMYALLICAKKFHLPLYVGFGIGLMLNIAFGALVGLSLIHIYYTDESFYHDKTDRVVNELKEKGLLTESDGAQVVDLSDDNMPPCLILKSDGTTIYATRDLAAIFYRKDTLH